MCVDRGSVSPVFTTDFRLFSCLQMERKTKKFSLHLNHALQNNLHHLKILKAQTNQMYWQCHAVNDCNPFFFFLKKKWEVQFNTTVLVQKLLFCSRGRDLSESRHYIRGLEWAQKGQKKQRKKRTNGKSLGLEGSECLDYSNFNPL